MIEPDKAQRVREAIEKMLGGRVPLPPHPERSLVWYVQGYIDTSRPADDAPEHRPKKQFRRLQKVRKAKVDLLKALESLDTGERGQLDFSIRQIVMGADGLSVGKIAGIEGATNALMDQLELLDVAVSEKLVGLKNRKDFHGRAGAPKDAWAHKIAYELAQLYARETGKRPTHSVTPGEARGRQAPHGQYCTALDEIFEALGILTGISHPAKVAVEGVSEDDLLTLAIERDRRNSLCRAYSTVARRQR